MKIAIIIPTYNERDNIEGLIREIFRINLEIQIEVLVIDDNSPDGTGDLVEKLSKQHKNIYIIHNNRKSGLCAAYKQGFQWILQRENDYVFQMDGDFSHHPKYILGMLEQADSGADLVIGSRYKDGIRIQGWSFFRLCLSFLANYYTRMMLGLKIYDMTSGFRCFGRQTLSTINLDSICSEGYAFQIEMVYSYLKKGYLITESPITFFERKTGRSKLSFKTVIEAFFTVLRLRIKQK